MFQIYFFICQQNEKMENKNLTKREGEAESKKSSIHWFAPQMTEMTTDELIKNWSQELLLSLSSWCKVPKELGQFLLLSQATSRQLDFKWSGRVINQCLW